MSGVPEQSFRDSTRVGCVAIYSMTIYGSLMKLWLCESYRERTCEPLRRAW